MRLGAVAQHLGCGTAARMSQIVLKCSGLNSFSMAGTGTVETLQVAANVASAEFRAAQCLRCFAQGRVAEISKGQAAKSWCRLLQVGSGGSWGRRGRRPQKL